MLSLGMIDKDCKSRKTYLQFHIPLDRRARWYRALKVALDGVRGTRWQDGHFHVTVAFINDEVDVAGAGKLAEVMDGELAGMAAPVLTLDTLEAFTTQGGGIHIVYLTASRVPDEWAAFVDRMRARLIGLDYHLGPFQLHVTLARVPAGSIDLEELRAGLVRIDVPKMSLALTKADYRFKGAKKAVRPWTLPVGSPPLPTVSHRLDHHLRKKG